MRFSRSRANIVCSPRSSSPGWSRTNRRRRIRSPCFRYNTGPRSSREAGSRTRMCVLPRHVGCRYPTSRWIFQVRTAGHEPRPSLRDGARGRNPRPLDEWATEWIGRFSNPRLLIFSQVLNRLSYRSDKKTQRKRPGVVVTPGLEEPCFALGAERHKRNGSEARRWIY